MTGIYKIINIVNQKVYIGKAYDINKRWKRHLNDLKKNQHRNKHLQASYNVHGRQNFELSVLEECTKDVLNAKEKYWVKYYNASDKRYGYNQTKGGDGGSIDFAALTQEEIIQYRTKLSMALTGANNPLYNKLCYTDGVSIKYLESTEIEVYEANGWYRGVPDFVRAKESEANMGEKNGFYGKHHNEQTIQSISQSRIGDDNWNYGKTIYHKGDKQKYVTADEVGEYIANGWKIGMSDINKQKISYKNTGRKVSEEYLRKRSVIYLYKDMEFIGSRKMRDYLKHNGFPKISQNTIYRLARHELVKGYDVLQDAIHILKEENE